MKPYRGPGEHTILQLEAMLAEREEKLHKQQLIIQSFRNALYIVNNWDLPSTGEYWDYEGEQAPVSYQAKHGSNGVRDYMKTVASESLDYERVLNEKYGNG